MEIRHPEIEVELVGHDGNAHMIIGKVAQALWRAGVSQEEISEFRTEAMSGNYDNVLQTCMKWVDVC